jgi:hypothetical protein
VAEKLNNSGKLKELLEINTGTGIPLHRAINSNHGVAFLNAVTDKLEPKELKELLLLPSGLTTPLSWTVQWDASRRNTAFLQAAIDAFEGKDKQKEILEAIICSCKGITNGENLLVNLLKNMTKQHEING